MKELNLPKDIMEKIDYLRHTRRYLHAHPELSFEEFETKKFILKELKKLEHMDVFSPTETSVVVQLDTKKSGEHIAFRADIDALPITEETKADYASQNPGVMHACGHDAHTSILLTLAHIIDEKYDQFTGVISLIFQHAEETPPGGAVEIASKDFFKKVDKIFALHVDSTIDVGNVAVSSGPATSAISSFEVEIKGKGGHSAYPNDAVDPIALSVDIIKDIYANLPRNFDARDSVSLVITEINGGIASNVIPGKAQFSGSIRTLKQGQSDKVKKYLENIIKAHISKYRETQYDFSFQNEYHPVINDKNLFNKVKNLVTSDDTNLSFYENTPMMTSEDFSSYTNIKSGCFILVGAKNNDLGFMYPHHHPKFNIDEYSLLIGLYVHSIILKEYCS